MGDIVSLDLTEVQITEELNDALNLQGMYGLVETGEMTIEEYNQHIIEFNKKWGYVDEELAELRP